MYRKVRNKFGFLVSAMIIFLLLVPFTAMTAGAEEKPAEETTGAAAARTTRFNESPMLSELVDAGKLPSVDERLPKNPFVRQVAIEIGDYGGTLRRVSGVGYRDYGTFFRQGEQRGLMQIPMDLDWHIRNGGRVAGLEAKYAESYTWSDGGKTITIKIREGARWSDGELITSEDIIWPFEQMYSHTGYFGEHIAMRAGFFGEYFVMKEIDDLTVSFTAGKTWDDLRNAVRWWVTPDLPSIEPWIPKDVDETKGVLWERNPYYADVDAEGNQLPYIDYVKVTPVADKEARYLAAMQGEVDIGGADLGDLAKHAVLKGRAAAGNYDVLIWQGSRQASEIGWR